MRDVRTLGLTILELLVAVAILGLLAAILLPATARVRAESRSIQCQSNVRQLAAGFHLYAEDHRGLLPDVDAGGAWDQLLRRYVGADGVYVCPSDDGDLALLAGLSYAWREALEVFDPSAALSGRDLRTAGPADLLMVFEGFPGLHQPDRLNAAALDTSVRTCTVAQLEADLERVVQ